MTRPSIEDTCLSVAAAWAERGTCARRKVGCVLVDKQGHTLSISYNGPPKGWRHCIDAPCAGAAAPSGTALDLCEAVHAEQNALMQCKDIFAVHVCYVTTSPCIHCVKMLLNTSCQVVVFRDPYAHNTLAREYWERAGRTWIHHL